ncbi:MAG: cation diffusion facilitator family transporter [Candidatus Krumholzibacteriia bacterium]
MTGHDRAAVRRQRSVAFGGTAIGLHHHDHEHLLAGSGSERAGDRRLLAGMGINLLLTFVQVAGGLVSGSLALVADALHNLNDAAALGLAVVARRIARKPADRRRTFGYRKAEVIGALVNTTALVMVGLYLVYEALARWANPQPVDGWIVVIVGGVALIVDAITVALTYALGRRSLNVKAAFVHNVSDALGSLAVMIAGALVLLHGWYLADLVATLLISVYILWQSYGLLRSSARILLDSAPRDVDLAELFAVMRAVPGVREVHHLHAWELDERNRALEAHVVVEVTDLVEAERIKNELKRRLHERFGFGHTTLEIEAPEACADDPHRCWEPPTTGI